jgi:hypothetical protein
MAPVMTVAWKRRSPRMRVTTASQIPYLTMRWGGRAASALAQPGLLASPKPDQAPSAVMTHSFGPGTNPDR